MINLLQGDVLTVLPTLPSGSVHCCVTSPPYWGLRDYGTASWEGGDPECDHIADATKTKHFGNEAFNCPSREATKTRGYYYNDICGKCGAHRVDSQLGLEPTPEEYVAHMVAVFREVKRVLRDDGVCFLNLGDSYYGSGAQSANPGGKTAKQLTNHGSYSVGVRCEQLCDTSDIAGQDCLGRDYPSESHGDEHKGNGCSRTLDTSHDPAAIQVRVSCSRILASMEELRVHLPNADSSGQPQKELSSSAILNQMQIVTRECELALSVLASTQTESFLLRQADSRLLGSLSVYQLSLDSFVAYAQEFVDRLGAVSETQHYTLDTASPFAELERHIRCTRASCSLVLSWVNHLQIQPQYTIDGQNVKLKPKDLVGIPWRVAFALQADGWYLRSDIIWHKPNPMPESVTDRPTKSHEYLFLLAKSQRYYYDAEAIAEPLARPEEALRKTPARFGGADKWQEAQKQSRLHNGNEYVGTSNGKRNRRSVWTITTQPFKGAHFAVMPEALVEPCVLAGSPVDGVLLDPFCGSGTVGVVSAKHGRSFIGIDLNPAYLDMARGRIEQSQPPLMEAC